MNERYALPTVHPYVSLLRKRSFMKRFSFIPFDVSIEGGLASQVEELKFPVYGEGLVQRLCFQKISNSFSFITVPKLCGLMSVERSAV